MTFGTHLYFSISWPFRHKILPVPLGYLLISPALSEVVIYPGCSGVLPYKIFPLIKMQVPDSFHTFDLKKFHAFSTLKSLSSLIQLTSLTSFLNFSKFILLKLRSLQAWMQLCWWGWQLHRGTAAVPAHSLVPMLHQVVLMGEDTVPPPPHPPSCFSSS